MVVLKTPSIDLRDDPAYLKRFMMEEWIARRLNSPHVLKVHLQTRKRSHLYLVLEHVDGQTLAQWMLDHPNPDLETVRRLVEQIAKGLTAFHRKEMVHQDLRPQNIMIDAAGTVRIIDFGSTKVAGVTELEPDIDGAELLGTAQYTAPECFLGEAATQRSDIFSLGVIAYQMLAGRLPYGADVARLRTRAHQRKLRYRPVRDTRPSVPDWVDGALKKAVQPFPLKRYEAVSEFIYDLRNPNPAFSGTGRVPWAERNPLLFWKTVSLILAFVVLCLLANRLSY